MRDGVRSQLGTQGVEEVLLLTYSNDYMGYVTTAEEYEQQNYEGGHTIFGKWTLAGFQTMFIRAASMLGRSPEDRLESRNAPTTSGESRGIGPSFKPCPSQEQAASRAPHSSTHRPVIAGVDMTVCLDLQYDQPMAEWHPAFEEYCEAISNWMRMTSKSFKPGSLSGSASHDPLFRK